MKQAVWRRELGRTILWSLLGALAGSFFNQILIGIAVALLLRLLRQVRNLAYLRAWLASP